MKITGDRMCFACGEDNPISLRLDFEKIKSGNVVAEFIPQPVHQGFDNIMHGGLINTLLDEAMAKVLYMNDIKAVTAEMKTRFKKPTPIGEKLKVTGILKDNHGKLYFTEAILENEKEEVMASAEAKFMKVKN